MEDDDRGDAKSGLVAVTEDKGAQVMDQRENREIRPIRRTVRCLRLETHFPFELLTIVGLIHKTNTAIHHTK
jgi:hypothetical protein